MAATAIAQLITSLGPGMAMAVLGIWFGLRKDSQCTELARQLTNIATGVAVSNAQVTAAIDGLREAIRQGTRS